MEALAALPEATNKWLQGTQCCWLYLQVTMLADISNSTGTHLAKWVTNPRYAQPSQHHATLKYPNQGWPNGTVLNDFVKMLQIAFTEGTNNKLRRDCKPPNCIKCWMGQRTSRLTQTPEKTVHWSPC
jgi:hypothetical protein